ncbi:MAG TPA: hypothetical protein VD772_12695, partial [Anseongella sp.]|nr:hypothetical protein [Anseongella sp.]
SRIPADSLALPLEPEKPGPPGRAGAAPAGRADPAEQDPSFIGPPRLRPSDYLPPAAADSLSRVLAKADSLRALGSDTAAVAPVDSARVLFAYNRVRIFKSDLQAIADSLVYTGIDSVMRCYKHPVVWSEGSQMSAEFMTIAMRNKKIDNMKMYRSAMILSQVETDTSKYNQMSGKDMTGLFVEGALSQLVVEGNARTIYYVPEDSLQTLGINYAENSRTILHFRNNELKTVELLKDVDQVTYPEGDPEAVTRLLGFHWRGNERPLDKDDIFRIVEPSAPPPPPESAAPRALRAGTAPAAPTTGLKPAEEATGKDSAEQEAAGEEGTEQGTLDQGVSDQDAAGPVSSGEAPSGQDAPGPETSDDPSNRDTSGNRQAETER